MKKYGALRIIAGILKFLGWVTILIGVLVVVIVILGNHQSGAYSSPYTSPIGVILIGATIGFTICLSGILLLAMGEMIEAFVDIAINTASLPTIALNTSSTVEFFERMSAAANRARDEAVRPPQQQFVER